MLQMAHKIIALLLLCTVNAYPQNFYVKPTGNDNNPDTSMALAFKTVQKGLDVVMPGGKVLVAGGTYKERLIWKRSGTATAPITLLDSIQNCEIKVTRPNLAR